MICRNAPTSELVDYQTNDNEWYVRHARRILQERSATSDYRRGTDSAIATRFRRAGKSVSSTEGTIATKSGARSLWAALLTAVCGTLPNHHENSWIGDTNPYVRVWAVQLYSRLENRALEWQFDDRLAELARTDPSPIVRLYIASAAQRLSPSERWDIVRSPRRPRRRRQRPQPAADGLVRRRAVGGGEPGPGARPGREGEAAAVGVHGPPDRVRSARRNRSPCSSNIWESTDDADSPADHPAGINESLKGRRRVDDAGRLAGRVCQARARARTVKFAARRWHWPSRSATRRRWPNCGEYWPIPARADRSAASGARRRSSARRIRNSLPSCTS